MEQSAQITCEHVDEAAAYVLGTMSWSQRELFAAHVRVCEVCADELELLSTASFAPELMAPRPVRPPHEHEHHDPARTRGHSEHVVGPLAVEHAQSHRNRSGGNATPHRGRRLRLLREPIPKPALGGLLALLVVAALTVYMSHQTAATTFARGTTAWPQTAGIALQLQGSHGELLLDHLPAAPRTEHYEVWALKPKSTTFTKITASLSLNAKGQAGVKIPGDIHARAALGVYAMPDSASQARPPAITDHPVAVVYVPAKSSR